MHLIITKILLLLASMDKPFFIKVFLAINFISKSDRRMYHTICEYNSINTLKIFLPKYNSFLKNGFNTALKLNNKEVVEYLIQYTKGDIISGTHCLTAIDTGFEVIDRLKDDSIIKIILKYDKRPFNDIIFLSKLIEYDILDEMIEYIDFTINKNTLKMLFAFNSKDVDIVLSEHGYIRLGMLKIL